MSATNDANDAAFGATGSERPAETDDAGDDGVAVHGIFDEIARDENVAVDIRESHIRNNEAVAVLMEDEAAFNFVAGNGFMLGEFVLRFARGGLVIARR